MASIISNIPNPVGRPPKYKKASYLWQRFIEYVEWADANPITTFDRQSATGDKKEAKTKAKAQAQVQRPYTLIAFITFAGIGDWSEFKQGKAHQTPEFSAVIRAIENAIKSQQIDGALVGVYNSNLTARLNNISEAVHTEVTGKDGAPVEVRHMSEADIKAELERINASLAK